MDWIDFITTAKQIKYKDWAFCLGEPRGGTEAYLQIRFFADGTLQKCRKWRLSPHMTKSEFVQTCLMAALSAEEHEVRERFTYRGKLVFGPHINVDKLFEACEELDVRTEAALTQEG